MYRHTFRRPASRPPTAALLLVLAQTLAVGATGQEGALVTDRPDFTESAIAVDRGHVQLESGYTYETADSSRTRSLGELLLRIGWTDRLELRLGINSYVEVGSPHADLSGFEDTSIGIKIDLAEGADSFDLLAPQAALLVGTSLPTGKETLGAPDPQPNLTLALAWPVTERLGLGSNLGVTWASDTDDRFLEGVASLALGASVTEALGAYVEYYAFLRESAAGSAEQFVNAGFTYLISNDLQIDLRVGTQVAGGTTGLFAGAGFAYRW